MSWRRDNYTDKLTGDLVAVEVVPLDDLRQHVSDENCECLPEFKASNGAPMLVHNAFDGREFSEPDNMVKGQ